jgi:ATP-dependent DNA ligase
MQSKEDGVRQIVVRSGESVTAANRGGLIVAMSASIEQAVRSIQTREPADFVLDGEATGDTYVAFDVLRVGAQDIRSNPLKTRLEILDRLTGATRHRALRKIPTACTRLEKINLFARL